MDVAARFQEALAAHKEGRLEAAEQGYLDVVSQIDDALPLHNLGVICEGAGRYVEAGEWYRRAAAAAPDDPAHQLALGVYLRTMRDFAPAEAAYRRTLALDPDYPMASVDLGTLMLAQGRYAEGWPRYEGRRAHEQLAKQVSKPEWLGEPLAGKRLFIWREQGAGDQIMMARFLPRVCAAAERVVYAGIPALERLLTPLGVDYQSVEGDFVTPPYDVWTLPYSLPDRLGVGEPPAFAPYLSGTPRPAGGRIGIAWRGQPGNRNNPFRSLPEAAAERLLALPGAISLEPEETGARDFQDTADIIAGLDLVISVDTSVAHLAGAMGHPVFVLLARYALDWQWPRAERSAWYPSARLFCQQTHGDWDPVIDAVVAALP